MSILFNIMATAYEIENLRKQRHENRRNDYKILAEDARFMTRGFKDDKIKALFNESIDTFAKQLCSAEAIGLKIENNPDLIENLWIRYACVIDSLSRAGKYSFSLNDLARAEECFSKQADLCLDLRRFGKYGQGVVEYLEDLALHAHENAMACAYMHRLREKRREYRREFLRNFFIGMGNDN